MCLVIKAIAEGKSIDLVLEFDECKWGIKLPNLQHRDKITIAYAQEVLKKLFKTERELGDYLVDHNYSCNLI